MSWPPTDDDLARLRETLAWVVERSPVLPPAVRRGRRPAGRPPHLRRRPRAACRAPRRPIWSTNQRAHPPFGDFLAVPRDASSRSLHTSPGPILHPAPRVRARRHAGAEGVDHGDGRAARRRRARDAVVPHHAGRPAPAPRLRGGGLPRASTAAPGSSRLQVEVAQAWGATVYAGTPSFLANLGDTAREMGLDPRRDLALPRRLLDRRGADADAAPRAAGHLRHRALRPLRRGADRPARRRVPRARGHAPARARSLLRVPRSGDRRAGRAGRHRRARRDAARAARAAARALRAGRRLPPARRARARAATRRCASSSSARWAPSARSRACSCIRRRCIAALSEFPERRPLPDRRRAPRGRSATTARVLRVGLADAAGRPDGASRARVAERVKATVLIGMDVELVRRGRRARGRGGAALRRRRWSIAGRRHDAAPGRATGATTTPTIQTMPLERVRALQAERLARQLDRIWDTPIPFFQRKLEAAGLRRADLRGLDDLRAIPTTREGRAARERGGASAVRRLSRRAASRGACASARRPARAAGRR